MNAPVPAPAAESLSATQRAALISLLADEDAAVYQSIRAKLLSFGPPAVEWLRAATLSSDPLLRRRARGIVRQLTRQAADERFLSYCLTQGERMELEEGSWLLAQTQYPDFNPTAYRALLDQYAAEVRTRTDLASGHPGAIVEAINHYLFHQLGYRGNEGHFYDPDSSYLNRVMDTRTGNPISLATIYLLVGRRLQLPITGLGFPGHFICRYQTAMVEFYLDPFHQGRLMTKADCVRYLLRTHQTMQEGYLAPMSPRRMVLRMCSNLHQIYLHHRLTEEGARLQRYVVALAK